MKLLHYYFDERQHLIKKASRTTRVFCLMFFFIICFIPARADEFGRLFLTSKERSILEKTRHENGPVEETITASSSPKTIYKDQIISTVPLTLKGVVKRSNGRNVAWLNKNNGLTGESTLQEVEIHEQAVSGGAIKFRLPDKEADFTLKVGQTYQIKSSNNN